MMKCDKIKHIMITNNTALIPRLVLLLALMSSDGAHRYSVTSSVYCSLIFLCHILFLQVDWHVPEGQDHVL